MGTIPHLSTYRGTKELTYNIYSYSSPDELILGNKQLGDLNIVSGEQHPDTSHITNAMRDSLHVTPLGGALLKYPLWML